MSENVETPCCDVQGLGKSYALSGHGPGHPALGVFLLEHSWDQMDPEGSTSLSHAVSL